MPQRTEKREEIEEKIIASCKILRREVSSMHNPYPIGHFSARIPGTDQLIIKPRDVAWDKVRPDSLVTFDTDYHRISGSELEIIEIPIHIEIYRARPEVMAVVHTHQTYATLMGTLGLRLEMLDANCLGFTAGVPTYDEDDDPTYFTEKIGTLIRERRQGEVMTKKMARASAIVLKAHGVVIAGRSVEEACMLTIALENAAKSQLIAASVRGQGKPIEEMCLKPRPPSAAFWKTLLDSYD
jgi:L-ribulose-5-phosphate 4-epimerase